MAFQNSEFYLQSGKYPLANTSEFVGRFVCSYYMQILHNVWEYFQMSINITKQANKQLKQQKMYMYAYAYTEI